jgi:hypothetical protein
MIYVARKARVGERRRIRIEIGGNHSANEEFGVTKAQWHGK